MTAPVPENANRRMAAIALGALVLDQLTKFVVLQYLGYAQEKVVIDGFFKFVHWGNTGAAWSMFHGNNRLLAIISTIALIALFIFRHHFETRTVMGQVAMGLLFGGIIGNIIDRLMPSRQHVVDFIYFHLHRRGAGEIGFPAFNVADTAICVAVGLLFIISWQAEMPRAAASAAAQTPAPDKAKS
jgi:signal peptidase II